MARHSASIRLLILLALVMYALLATHALALWFSWYWAYPWFDMLTHLWGGACVALGALWVTEHSGYFATSRSPAYSVAFAIAAVGIVWEGYELLVQTYFSLPMPPNYLPDTLLDLVMDGVGAVVGYFLFKYIGKTGVENQA